MIHLLLAMIYLAFISLGLPDGLLGAAWPVMYEQLGVPISGAGIISVLICAGTIVSSLCCDWVNRKLGTGKVTAISVALTAMALLGFSVSNSFWMLCLWAIPYGLGAGSVDASLNNYVALHYASRHMSWLHCMWGLGASIGPYIMGAVLTGGGPWTSGYRIVGLLQVVLTAALIMSLRLWKGNEPAEEVQTQKKVPLSKVFAIPGAPEVMITFFCYCALEQTAGMWASSYLVLQRGIAEETAASFASLFYVGITLGRGLNGFLTVKFRDTQLVRMGLWVVLAGVAAMLLPLAPWLALLGLILIGLGCAPIFPCTIHSTPQRFGQERSQMLIGVQMASAYVGSLAMPPLFGILANTISIGLFPVYLLAILVLMAVMHEKIVKKTGL